MTTPRMFCDICDQFDLHETEDCPRQAQDFLDMEKVVKGPKKVPVERPYCKNCESKNLIFRFVRIIILFAYVYTVFFSEEQKPTFKTDFLNP